MAQLKVRPIGSTQWTTLPEPDYNGGLTWAIMDEDAPSTGRDNSTGLMHRDRVAIKRKISCKWTNREASEISSILNSAIKDVFFECQYYDYQTSSLRTSIMYVGDRTVPVYSTVLGANHQTTIIGGFTANFIER